MYLSFSEFEQKKEPAHNCAQVHQFHRGIYLSSTPSAFHQNENGFTKPFLKHHFFKISLIFAVFNLILQEVSRLFRR